MASDKNDSVGIRLQKELDAMKARAKDRGATPAEIKQLERDFFVKRKMKKKPKTMTAAKGGVAKKKMRGGGMAKMAKKKMRGGGMMKRKMAGGGMAKMAKRKKMMGGGMAKMAKKKKMMRGGSVKKK